MAFQKNISGLMFIMVLNSLMVYGQSEYKISPIDINTKSKELAPAFYKNSIVFCSDRRNDILMTYTDPDNNPLTNLYVADLRKSGKFENPKLLARELTTFMFEGPSTFTKDGNTIYFTRTINVNPKGRNHARQDTTFGIFTASLNHGVWSNIKAFNFNSSSYNTGYPCISEDGLQLFFCSDAPGGSGGLDIYVSAFRNGNWDKPENLGPNVNTSKNEVFPFLQHGGKLYFASRGINQQGDLDIYYTMKVNGKWQQPVPLAAPFNTSYDDYGLIFNALSDTGYFVSNRAGSADIFGIYSTIPGFTHCVNQKENDYCFVFYESNNNELDTTAYGYEWDLGDGTKVRSIEAEHCFAEPGTYLVQLNIIDKLTKEILMSQATYNFSVEKIEQPYILSPDTVYAGKEITMNAKESYFKDFNVNNYYWDFGDGTRLQGLEIKHSFSFPGIYQIRLGLIGGSDSQPETSRNNCVIRQIVVLEAK